jgi:hypothetical protein
MTHQTLKELAETIEASNESIAIVLQEDKLIIKTEKNSLWVALSVFGMALSILLIWYYNKRPYNLEIGLAILCLSIYEFWRMQKIKNTLIIDLHQKTLSVIPNFIFHRFILSKIIKVNTTFSLNNLPEIYSFRYYYLTYHWTQRLSLKQGIWTIYLLEFDKKKTAEKVLQLLKR